ncbi:MAG TPA: isoamylase early set domain-containing protein [Candidatus Krumholzibacteria bacterium]
MKIKQVAATWRATAGAASSPWRRLMHAFMVARIAAWILMLPQAVGADSAASSAPAPRLDSATAQSTESLLSSLYRTQNTAGQYAPGDDAVALLARPVFATMAWDAYTTTHNTAMLAQSANSIARYYTYLFSTVDRDGDHMVETTATIQKRDATVEDPAFNALLAVDARNLARIHLELRRTMQALYWYDVARAIERAVVSSTFDPDQNFCFARDPGSGQFIRRVAPSAALAADFTFAMGENHAARMRSQVVDWASQSVGDVAPSDRPARAIDLLCATAVLSDGDHAPVIDAVRRAMPAASPSGNAIERYALARARLDLPLTEDDTAIGLLLYLQRATQIPDVERFRIEQAIPKVRALASTGRAPQLTVNDADEAIRTVFSTVSALRERLRKTSFYGADDRRAFAGGDPNVATQRLLDDVTALAHRAENRLFEMRYAASSPRLSATLVNDRVVALDPVTVRWETTAKSPLSWKTISIGVFGEAVSPLSGAPFSAAPGAPLRLVTKHLARGNTGALRLMTFTAVFQDQGGTLSRYHVTRSVYLSPPVGITARFPEGRTMAASTVPVQVVMRRNAGTGDVAKYFWFSPSGLRLNEGNSGVVRFGTSDSVVVTLHVEVPSPCRPGVFPFTLKFFAGDRDAGTVTASLFKPYRWTFVGPFATDGGLSKPLAPERGVNLLQSYPGPNGSAVWRTVPELACGPRGGIALSSLAGDRGVYYLYTIVGCAYENDMKARLWSNGPAALYVNGRPEMAITSSRGDSATAQVHLDPDKNHILIKVIGDRDTRVSFALGDEQNLAADEFDNNLSELAGGYRELTARELSRGSTPSESRRLVTLRFQDPEANSVAVVGSFNGWSPASNPMRKQGDTWELTLSLLPGRYSYRFVVDQKKQVLDPSQSATEPDGYGGKNSVLVVNK